MAKDIIKKHDTVNLENKVNNGTENLSTTQTEVKTLTEEEVKVKAEKEAAEKIRQDAEGKFQAYMADPTKGMAAFSRDCPNYLPLIVGMLMRGENPAILRKTMDVVQEERNIHVEKENAAKMTLFSAISERVSGFMKDHARTLFDSMADGNKVSFMAGDGKRKDSDMNILTPYSDKKVIRTKVQFILELIDAPKSLSQTVK